MRVSSFQSGAGKAAYFRSISSNSSSVANWF
jgi:hypothetical protein